MVTNIFMSQVLNKTVFTWKNCFKYWKNEKAYKKFRKTIIEGSPSFGTLWQFADFIKYSELIYFYSNTSVEKNNPLGLYSSVGYIPGENGFKIYSEDSVIIVKLYSDSQRVGIDIERKNGGQIKTNFAFQEEKWIDTPDAYDEMLLDNIISIITHKMIALVEWDIKKRFC